MYAFANEDPGVSLTLANDRKSQQVLDFEGVPLPDDIDDSLSLIHISSSRASGRWAA